VDVPPVGGTLAGRGGEGKGIREFLARWTFCRFPFSLISFHIAAYTSVLMS
jgi:hypothetical protein